MGHQSIAAIIDAHMDEHTANHKRKGSSLRWYAVIGPAPRVADDDDTECDGWGLKCFAVLSAYDALHAKYVVALDFMRDAIDATAPDADEELVNSKYPYPITSYLDELLEAGADLQNSVDIFRTHSIEPFAIVPYNNEEILLDAKLTE